MTEDGKEKKVNIDFEPFKPINTSLYLCDNKFHTEVCFFVFEKLKKKKFEFTVQLKRHYKHYLPMTPGSASLLWMAMVRYLAPYKAMLVK